MKRFIQMRSAASRWLSVPIIDLKKAPVSRSNSSSAKLRRRLVDALRWPSVIGGKHHEMLFHGLSLADLRRRYMRLLIERNGNDANDNLLYELVGADPPALQPALLEDGDVAGPQGAGFPTRADAVHRACRKVEGGVSKTVPVIRDGDKVVADSFAIALYLDEAYPDRPTLFGGEGGKAMARFIERWSQLTVHPLSRRRRAAWTSTTGWTPPDQAYFRESRETRFGKRLEEVAAGRDGGLAAFRASLEPLRSMLTYQPFIGGAVAALCRLHRLRRVPVGARHVALPDAGRRRSGGRTGSSAASTCMAGSAAACRRRRDLELRRLASLAGAPV